MTDRSTITLLTGVVLAVAGCPAEEPAGADAAPDSKPGDAPLADALADRGVTEAGGDADGGQTATGVFVLKVSGRTLELTVLSDRVVRVHYLPASGKAHPERGWTTMIQSWPTTPLTFTDAGATWTYETAALQIRVYKADATVSFHDLAGKPISKDVPNQVPAGSYPRTVRKVLPTDEHFYGLGEKTGPLDKRGQALQMWTTDPLYPKSNYTTTADPIYQAVPFVIGLRKGKAYGLYLNSTFRTHFDMGKTLGTELSLRTEGGDLDYFFIHGPSVAGVVRAYTGLVGRHPLPPLWSLGYHQCRWSYYPESVVRKITTELRKRKIPCDGFWLDIDYMRGFRSFTWDKTRFPDPKKLLSDLSQQGFKVTAIIDPGIKHDPSGGYKVYSEGVSKGHFVTMPNKSVFVGKVWPGKAVFPDFTRQATRAWWSGLVKEFAGAGLRGVWIDMNEPVTWDPAGFPLDTVFDGEGKGVTDHREARNVYALLMARATRKGLQQATPKGRPFVLTRAGFAGIQRYSVVWTGDMESSWAHLGMAPAMLMNMGLSGIAIAGTDVGGFSGNPGAELFVRWMQLGAISPFFRTHVSSGSPQQEPWSFGTEAEKISRAHIELRYRLLPYIYSLVRQASAKGDPVLRPLLYEFAADEKPYKLSDQLMLGPFVMVAPVLHATRKTRAAYLPAGAWFDHWTGAVFAGPGPASVPAPLSRLPLLVRAGAIVPSTEVRQYVGAGAPAQTLTLDLYPVKGQGPTSFTLYRDDGETQAFKQGAFQELGLTLTTTAAGATLSVAPPKGSHAAPEKYLYLRFHGVAKVPSAVTTTGAALTKRASLAELAAKNDGWFHETQGTSGTVHARLAFPSKQGAKVVCSYDATPSLSRKVSVTFTAKLPAATPAGDIYMATNLHGWIPTGFKMTRSGNTATATLSMQQGMALEYKYTRGDWKSVEKGLDCSEQPNRYLSVVDASGGKQAVSDSVGKWADGCKN